eukprot:TRINITY_DN3794_c0_g1_i2.p1 TRINITY_DN3794_c0_g1~~TRINITY_DN3794_c0_g1_i2.p1  ORF type:complete len:283 (-),score=49.31 TRINITY_DN3794_c0_g1_i2:359-1207(-)
MHRRLGSLLSANLNLHQFAGLRRQTMTDDSTSKVLAGLKEYFPGVFKLTQYFTIITSMLGVNICWKPGTKFASMYDLVNGLSWRSAAERSGHGCLHVFFKLVVWHVLPIVALFITIDQGPDDDRRSELLLWVLFKAWLYAMNFLYVTMTYPQAWTVLAYMDPLAELSTPGGATSASLMFLLSPLWFLWGLIRTFAGGDLEHISCCEYVLIYATIACLGPFWCLLGVSGLLWIQANSQDVNMAGYVCLFFVLEFVCGIGGLACGADVPQRPPIALPSADSADA